MAERRPRPGPLYHISSPRNRQSIAARGLTLPTQGSRYVWLFDDLNVAKAEAKKLYGGTRDNDIYVVDVSGLDIRPDPHGSGPHSFVSSKAIPPSRLDLAVPGGSGGDADEIIGWERLADDDACTECLADDGNQHPVDDPLPLHPNCGCGAIPVLAGEQLDVVDTPSTDHPELGTTLTKVERPEPRELDATDVARFHDLNHALGMDVFDGGAHPERYETVKLPNGQTVRRRRADVSAPEIITRTPERYFEGDFPMVQDKHPDYEGFAHPDIATSDPYPLPRVFRAVSEEDYQQAKAKGYLKSDQRMNLSQREGTVAEVGNPIFYLPGQLASDGPGTYEGRILAIDCREEDGWKLDRDSYVKTLQPIPMDRVTASPKILTERDDRGRISFRLEDEPPEPYIEQVKRGDLKPNDVIALTAKRGGDPIRGVVIYADDDLVQVRTTRPPGDMWRRHPGYREMVFEGKPERVTRVGSGLEPDAADRLARAPVTDFEHRSAAARKGWETRHERERLREVEAAVNPEDYRDPLTGEEADEHVSALQQPQVAYHHGFNAPETAHLDPESPEAFATSDYTAWPHWRPNEHLRSGGTIDTMRPEDRHEAKALDKAIEEQPPLDRPVVYWRAVGTLPPETQQQLDKGPGGVFTERGWQSAAAQEDLAEQFASGLIPGTDPRKQQMLVITVPRGERVLQVRYPATEMSPYFPPETILPHGRRMRVDRNSTMTISAGEEDPWTGESDYIDIPVHHVTMLPPTKREQLPRLPRVLTPEPADFREVDGARFSDVIEKARAESELIRSFTTHYTPEQYAHMRCFLSPDGRCGGALKLTDDGHLELVSVFNNGGAIGSSRPLMERLKAEGADRLDCIGDQLRRLYEREGFHVTQRFDWDDSLAPEGWDYAKRGRPPVYVMELPRERPLERLTTEDVEDATGPRTFTGDSSAVRIGLEFGRNTRRVVTVRTNDGREVTGRLVQVSGNAQDHDRQYDIGGHRILEGTTPSGLGGIYTHWGLDAYVSEGSFGLGGGREIEVVDVGPDEAPTVQLDPDVRKIQTAEQATEYLRRIAPESDLKGMEDWRPQGLQEMCQAVKDWATRYPDCVSSLKGIKSQASIGNDKLDPEVLSVFDSGDTWAVTCENPRDARPRTGRKQLSYVIIGTPSRAALTRLGEEYGLTWDQMRPDAERQPVAAIGGLSHITETPYGRTMHELGHVWAHSTGVAGMGHASDFVADSGIDPNDAVRVSEYGGANPQEALAELFCTAFSRAEIDRMEPDMREKLLRFRAAVGSKTRRAFARQRKERERREIEARQGTLFLRTLADLEWNQDPDKPIPVHGNVEIAARLLADGYRVDLEQPREASVLVHRLQELGKDAKARGDKAPNYDLCRVTIRGTNLFCVQSKGFRRVDMPQLAGVPIPGSKADKLEKNEVGGVDLSELFRLHLEELGFRVDNVTEPASRLRPTQTELNGPKVGAIAGSMERGEHPPGWDARLFTSRDNYIVDGHHRWAARVTVDLEDDDPDDDVDIPIARVDMPIGVLVAEAARFAREWGIPQAGVQQAIREPLKPEHKRPSPDVVRLVTRPRFSEPSHEQDALRGTPVATARVSDELKVLWARDAQDAAQRVYGTLVPMPQIEQARRRVQAATERSLEHRGLGDRITVYRAELPGEQHSDAPTNVSLDPVAAYDIAMSTGRAVHEYEVDRDDVLIDSNAFFPGGHIEEHELVVRGTDLMRPKTLTDEDRAVLTRWTAASSHEIRSGYENGKPKTDEARQFARALDKLPTSSGTVYRGINYDLRKPPDFTAIGDRIDDPADVAALWRSRQGDVLDWGEPSSTTIDSSHMEHETLGPGTRLVFEIDSDRLRSVSEFAMWREAWEAEDVIPPGQFRVDGVDVRDFPVLSPFSSKYGKTEQIAVVHLTDVTLRRVPARPEREEIPALATHFDLPKTGKVREAVDQTIDALDETLPNLPPMADIPVKPSGGRVKGGSYNRKGLPGIVVEPESIKVTTARPAYSFVHEFGHMVDNVLLGASASGTAFGSTMAAARRYLDDHPGEGAPEWFREPSPEMLDVWDALVNSNNYKHLGKANMDDYAQHRYLLSPTELFARAFGQWLAVRSMNPALKAALDHERDPETWIGYAVRDEWRRAREYMSADLKETWMDARRDYYREHPDSIPGKFRYRQWTDDEFKPIERALDRLADAQGWT